MAQIPRTRSEEAAHLRRRAREAEQRARRLEAASGASEEIAWLRQRVSDLEGDLSCASSRLLDSQNALERAKHANAELKDAVRILKKRTSSLGFDVALAHSEWKEQERTIAKLEKRRREWADTARMLGAALKQTRAEARTLRARLNRSPNNSSLPPSSDPVKKRIPNSREKTGRRPGGQPGHVGHARKATAPDIVVDIEAPQVCPHCKATASLIPVGAPSTRRVTDIVVSTITTQYASCRYACPECGRRIAAPFPVDAPNEENWGPSVKNMLVWTTDGCNVPLEKARELLYEISAGRVNVSKGACSNFKREFSRRASGEVAALSSDIETAAVVGLDATHTRCNGAQTYIYTFNTPTSALFRPSERKGKAPLVRSVIDGHNQALIHDHDTSFYSFGGAHAECNVHALRYLKGVIENEPERSWAKAMSDALKLGLKLSKRAKEAGVAIEKVDIDKVEQAYDGALVLAQLEYERDAPFHPKYKPDGIALSNRLARFRDAHLLFLHDPRVPFDNNASERLLRCAKGKLKQSGGFRSFENGERPYCDFLSVTKTARLRGLSPYRCIGQIFEGAGGVLGQATAGTVAQ